MASLDIKLSKGDRVFLQGEQVDGYVVVTTPASLSHGGLRLHVTGNVALQASSKSASMLETLYSSTKSIPIIQKDLELCPAGKLAEGSSRFPFQAALEPLGSTSILETFHGAYISVQYLLTATLSRGLLQKPLSIACEFLVETHKVGPPLPIPTDPVRFVLTPETQRHALLAPLRTGGFAISGSIATRASLSDPILGELTVDHTALPIRSIDVKLLRLEALAVGEKMVTERTEVQVTQVADGDVCRGLQLPIYIILPRLLTCPTLTSESFSIGFELQVVAVFEAEDSGSSSSSTHERTNSLEKETIVAPKPWMAVETLPLLLLRS